MKYYSIDINVARGLPRSGHSVIRLWLLRLLLLPLVAVGLNVSAASSAEPGDPFLAFFALRDNQTSSLYRTDGTPSGTRNIMNLVKRDNAEWPILTSFHNASGGAILVIGRSMDLRLAGIYVFDATSNPRRVTSDTALRLATDIRPIRMIDGRLFFVVDNALLFASDGTVQGTRRFTGRFLPGLVDVFPLKDQHIIITNERSGPYSYPSSKIYSRDNNTGHIKIIYEFKVDGGSITRSPDRDGWTSAQVLTSVVLAPDGNSFIFSRSNGRQQGLWTSDGTTEGTRRLISTSENRQLGPPFIEFAGQALFLGYTGATGQELWITDGTRAGTRRLRDIRPTGYSSRLNLEQFVVHAGKAYFLASPSTPSAQDRGLWVTDGTTGGTRPVRTAISGQTIRLISSDIYGDRTNELAVIGDEIFFAGTVREGACTGSQYDFCRFTTDLYSFNTVTRVTRKRVAASQHICRYGKIEVIGGDYSNIRAFGSKLFFSSTGKGASSEEIGCGFENGLNAEPWIFDATTGEARQLREIFAGPRGSMPVPIGHR